MDSVTVNGRQAKFLKTTKGSLLNDEERGWVEEVFEDCEILHAVGVARLYTHDRRKSFWEYTGVIGAAVVVTESTLQNIPTHYLRIVDLRAWNPNNAISFEQEFYEGFQLTKATSLFYTFEMNEGMAALCFSSEDEALEFYKAAQNCIVKNARQYIAEEGNVMARVRGQVEDISYPSIAKTGIHTGKMAPAPKKKKSNTFGKEKDKEKKKDKDKKKK